MKSPISLASATAVGLLVSGGALPTTLAAKDFGDYLSYSLGNLAIQPQYDQTEVFTDNLFLSDGVNRVADLTSIFSPGIKLQYGADGQNQAHLVAGHDEVLELDNSDKSTRQDRLAFDLKLVVSRLTIEGQDSVSWMSSFIGGVLSQTRTLIDRRLWTDKWKVTYDYTAKTDFYVVGYHQDTDYQKGLRLFDQNDLKATLGASYQLSTKYRILIEGFYGQSALSSNSDGMLAPPFSSVYGGYVGARGDFTRKLFGDLRFGYEQRSFGSGQAVAAQTPGISADLTYLLRPKTTLTVVYLRNTAPSPQIASQFQVTDTVSLQARQVVGTSGKWLLRGNVNYVTSGYGRGGVPGLNQSRDDSRWLAGLTLLYQPRAWMTCSLGYEYENYSYKFADPTAANTFILPRYHANRITLAVAIGY